MLYVAIFLAKIINFIIKFLNLGAGYTWPGHLALKINPKILDSKKRQLPKGVILISGTNGKTTTSKLITHLLTSAGLKVVSNKTGANLLNGITSAILLDLDILGRHQSDLGVFEADEFSLPKVLNYLKPRVLILLNLSRDQLDRYGEVDTIFEGWKEAISTLDPKTSVFIDSDQEYFEEIPSIFKGRVEKFSDGGEYIAKTKLKGDFNARNVNASVLTAKNFGLSEEKIINSLKSFEVAYGRGEYIEYREKVFHILLAKNPASFNNNLDTLINDNLETNTLLFILNDNIPDGRDVSWIYDIDPEKLAKACEGRRIYVSGSRCLDMAIRLNYAGVEVLKDDIIGSLGKMVKKIVSDNSLREITVLPNYSAMLQLRKVLLGRQIL